VRGIFEPWPAASCVESTLEGAVRGQSHLERTRRRRDGSPARSGPLAPPATTTPSANFAYLAHHDARLVALATQAEEHFAGDPIVALFKLRQFGEVLAQRADAKVGLYLSTEEGQQQLIDRLWERKVIGATQRTLFHDLRRVGNAAVHEGKGDHGEALHQLRMARELAIWFQRSFGRLSCGGRMTSPISEITFRKAVL